MAESLTLQGRLQAFPEIPPWLQTNNKEMQCG